ncbi:hypothetical protein [Streptomyces sp. NBC_00690]|uniref:hypothetical protein n=1 Tax=Streptomyces sp. NBC_00690 TaxID=2975808 RepID=UPI003FA6CF56
MALGEVASVDVRGQGVGAGVVTVVGGVCGFDAGDLACLEAVASVDDPAVGVEDDGMQETLCPDVVGEGVEVLLVEVGEEKDGRVEVDLKLLGMAGRGDVVRVRQAGQRSVRRDS